VKRPAHAKRLAREGVEAGSVSIFHSLGPGPNVPDGAKDRGRSAAFPYGRNVAGHDRRPALQGRDNRPPEPLHHTRHERDCRPSVGFGRLLVLGADDATLSLDQDAARIELGADLPILERRIESLAAE
jgi:hypothetical protein